MVWKLNKKVIRTIFIVIISVIVVGLLGFAIFKTIKKERSKLPTQENAKVIVDTSDIDKCYASLIAMMNTVYEYNSGNVTMNPNVTLDIEEKHYILVNAPYATQAKLEDYMLSVMTHDLMANEFLYEWFTCEDALYLEYEEQLFFNASKDLVQPQLVLDAASGQFKRRLDGFVEVEMEGTLSDGTKNKYLVDFTKTDQGWRINKVTLEKK